MRSFTQKLVMFVLFVGWGTSAVFSQFDDRQHIGLGWNYNRLGAGRNLEAYGKLRDYSNQTVNKEHDLSQWAQGPAILYGVEVDYFAFAATWNRSDLRSTADYTNVGGSGIVYNSSVTERFVMNVFSISAAAGVDRAKVGMSLDYSKIKAFVKGDYTSPDQFRKHYQNFNFGFSAFADFTPIKYLRISPYVRWSIFDNDIWGSDESYIRLNHWINYGVCAYLLLPAKLQQ